MRYSCEIAVSDEGRDVDPICSIWIYLGQIKTGTVATIIIIPVHVQDLLALDGEQARQNTFSQTSTENNDLERGPSATRIAFARDDENIRRTLHPCCFSCCSSVNVVWIGRSAASGWQQLIDHSLPCPNLTLRSGEGWCEPMLFPTW